jgi:4-diphosphocytidyl-2C-methyl-D-erythritol kinase
MCLNQSKFIYNNRFILLIYFKYFHYREGLSTALVFKTLNLTTLNSNSPESLLEEYQTKGPLQAAQNGGLINDLEPPSFLSEPFLETIKKEILKQKSTIAGAMMSGSGMC